MSAKRFAKTTARDSLFLLVSELSDTPRDVSLPPIYSEFADVFSEKEAAKLSLEKVVHEINLKLDASSPPYGPLYPCSATELDHLL
jgi:hypothetical protein